MKFRFHTEKFFFELIGILQDTLTGLGVIYE